MSSCTGAIPEARRGGRGPESHNLAHLLSTRLEELDGDFDTAALEEHESDEDDEPSAPNGVFDDEGTLGIGFDHSLFLPQDVTAEHPVDAKSRKKRKRRQKDASTEKPPKSDLKKFRAWRRQNRKAVEGPVIHQVTTIDIQSLVTGDQHHRTKVPFPKFDSEHPLSLVNKDGRAISAMFVDAKRVPIALVIPKWLALTTHDQAFEALKSFGRAVNIQLRAKADSRRRDNQRGYTRRICKEEIHGLFQLVATWRDIGQGKGTPSGPSKDMTKNVVSLQESLKLLAHLQVIGRRLHHLLAYFDPPQSAYFTRVKEKLRETDDAYRLLTSLDPTYFQGRSLIFNRETGQHVDEKDPKFAWTPVTTLGVYKQGFIHMLGYKIPYQPGTLVLLRGGVIPHRVSFEGGQRVAIAHFLHQDVVDQVESEPIPVSDLTALRAAWLEYHRNKQPRKKQRAV